MEKSKKKVSQKVGKKQEEEHYGQHRSSSDEYYCLDCQEWAEKQNPFKAGDKVIYQDDEYVVYAIYSATELSLGLLDYPDTEQDFQVDIKDIKRKFDEKLTHCMCGHPDDRQPHKCD